MNFLVFFVCVGVLEWCLGIWKLGSSGFMMIRWWYLLLGSCSFCIVCVMMRAWIWWLFRIYSEVLDGEILFILKFVDY